MADTPSTIIWWLKEDFRLDDNPALVRAFQLVEKREMRTVIPLFVIEPSWLEAPETSGFHVAAVLEAVTKLRQTLRSMGGELLIMHGEVFEVLQQISQDIALHAIVAHEEVGADRTFKRDQRVASWCREQSVEFIELIQTGVFRRLEDRDKRGRLWKQFMNDKPFDAPPAELIAKRIAVPKKLLERRSDLAKRPSPSKAGHVLSAEQSEHRQTVHHEAAVETMESFLYRRGQAYSGGISSPLTAFDAGSRMSVHLAWGTISPRRLWHRTEARSQDFKRKRDEDSKAWRKSLRAFTARLNWRDHFVQRLETEPSMEFHSLNRAYDNLPVSEDANRLEAWKGGRTGLPMVDACIRCVQTTGFLNFRMRSMITSAACHTLRLPWNALHIPMARWWADYEPGIHLSQLQMQAGVVGINTLRTYNPAKQITDQDPECIFVKRWLPELKAATPKEIIDHQESPCSYYLPPIVNYKTEVAQMRSDYYRLRRQPETKELAATVYEKHGSRKRPPRRKPKTTTSNTKQMSLLEEED
ncbi:MAG: FAD-binding domain-containing protein [Planctomycetota bacterium]